MSAVTGATFRTSIHPTPGGGWRATFTTAGVEQKMLATTEDAARAWLAAQVWAWLGDRVTVTHPDGGVLVLPTVDTPRAETPQLMVMHVNEASPLVASPVLAAEVGERVVQAARLLAEAALLASQAAGRVPVTYVRAVEDAADMTGQMGKRLDVLAGWLGVDALTMTQAHAEADVQIRQVQEDASRRLRVVPVPAVLDPIGGLA